MTDYNRFLLELNKNTQVSFYLCVVASKKMYTYHEGRVFEGDAPDWMIKYAGSTETILPFEQNGRKKQYCKWKLDSNNIFVFIDEPDFSLQNTMFRYMLCRRGDLETDEQKALLGKYKSEAEDLKYSVSQYKVEINQLKNNNNELQQYADTLQKEIESLKEQNSDQALRLKNALSENLELSKLYRSKMSDGEIRLSENIREWERKNQQQAVQGIVESNEESYQRDLSYVIKCLNNIISTGDASNINVEILSTIVTPITQKELERSPDHVKNYIAKLIGMDRTGKLTPAQLKKLHEAFRGV